MLQKVPLYRSYLLAPSPTPPTTYIENIYLLFLALNPETEMYLCFRLVSKIGSQNVWFSFVNFLVQIHERSVLLDRYPPETEVYLCNSLMKPRCTMWYISVSLKLSKFYTRAFSFFVGFQPPCLRWFGVCFWIDLNNQYLWLNGFH